MKSQLFFCFFIVCVSYTSSFLNVREFRQTDLLKCYDGLRDNPKTNELINGQEYPLPNSLETFVSLVEKLETIHRNTDPLEMSKNLLLSFSVEGMNPDLKATPDRFNALNELRRAFFDIPNVIGKSNFRDEDLTHDEKCALHFMLSHTINDTLDGNEDSVLIDGRSVAKRPREYGVVSLHAKKIHAIALARVLLGLMAGLKGNNEMEASAILKRLKPRVGDELKGVKVKLLPAVTLGDLISAIVSSNYQRDNLIFFPNGQWNEDVCPTEYYLNDNVKSVVSYSLLRGAIDGFILGRLVEENLQTYKELRLSQILRMYYGPSGLVSENSKDQQWCNRNSLYNSKKVSNEEYKNYLKLYNVYRSAEDDSHLEEVDYVLSNIENKQEIFEAVSAEASTECRATDSSQDAKCETPTNIFAILDGAQLNNNFQMEVIGKLSVDFDIRPHGSLVGVYVNSRSMQRRSLDLIANHTGISGCPGCYIRPYRKFSGSRLNEEEVFQSLNETLTEFEEAYDKAQENLHEPKSGTPAKVILYFNNGNPTNTRKLKDAVWEVVEYFREATILAIGSNTEALQVFTRNDDTDIFSEKNVDALVPKLKSRICKVPAEFQFKKCESKSRGVDTKQLIFIPANKIQYWAMYPKYFLKSFSISLKFKPEDGAQIKVCFSRNYYRIIEDRSQQYVECQDSTGAEIEFKVSNPCKRRNEHNCDPFYFFVEGRKTATTLCQNLGCSSAKDIKIEFQHEGISCSAASFVSVSALTFLFATFIFFVHRY
ncbi:hypothetical protein X975_08449, partial [Stegodyphus mimosarum]